jgi:hypothetical protein
LAASALSLGLGCGSDEDDSSGETSQIDGSTPGVSANSGDEVVIAGKLALGDLGLTQSTTPGLLAVSMSGATPLGNPTEVELGADGSFNYQASQSMEQAEAIKTEMEKDPADWDYDYLAEQASKLFGESITKEQLKEIGSTQVKSYMDNYYEQLTTLGTNTVLIAYNKSGDKVAEAKSFRFIGMPTGSGKNLIAWSNQAMKGNLALGEISLGSNGEGAAELSAKDGFDLSDEALNSMADAGKALKAFKNRYMNDDWKAETFWAWYNTSSGGTADIIDQFSDPSKASYNGVGFYIGSVTDTPFTYDQVCGSNSNLEFTPPSAVSVATGTNSEETQEYSVFTNGSAEQSMQGDNRICSGDSFYAREDDTNNFMINFGTGGGIAGDLPEGLWKMEWEGSEIARFDAAAATPIDADGNPTVFLPSVKFVTENGQFTGAQVKFYYWDGSSLTELTDPTPVKKLVSQIQASITRASDNGETRGNASFPDDSDSNIATVTFDEPLDQNDADYFSVSYTIGDANYRTEYRDDN